VLKRLKGALAMLAPCTALDPFARGGLILFTSNGRMRHATVRLAVDVLNAVASASPTRLATCIAVLTAVSLPAPSALAALPRSTSCESDFPTRLLRRW